VLWWGGEDPGVVSGSFPGHVLDPGCGALVALGALGARIG
jgi:hypothetical protein